MKIGILSFPIHPSHGCTLQQYALATVLNSMGHEVIIINRQWKKKSWLKLMYSIVRRAYYRYIKGTNCAIFYTGVYPKEVLSGIYSFIDKYFPVISSPCYNTLDLNKLCSQVFDAIIVGSDQVWRPKYVPDIYNYYLDFLVGKTSVKRIAYAASFGTSEWEYEKDMEQKCSLLVHQFDAVSVREDSGVELCIKHFGIHPTHVLDPTMLLTVDNYKEIIEKAKKNDIEANLLTYVLDQNEEKENVIRNISDKFKLSPLEQSKNTDDERLATKERAILSLEAWLMSFAKAHYVFTDSFHATVFAIIFNKPFIVYGNSGRGLTRFTSLLKIFGLENRLILSSNDLTDDLLNENIDWEMVNSKLDVNRKESIDFLRESLIAVNVQPFIKSQ